MAASLSSHLSGVLARIGTSAAALMEASGRVPHAAQMHGRAVRRTDVARDFVQTRPGPAPGAYVDKGRRWWRTPRPRLRGCVFLAGRLSGIFIGITDSAFRIR